MTDDNCLNINIYFGTALILQYNYIFQQLLEKNIYNKINVSLNKAVLYGYRGEYDNIDNFYNEYHDIMRFVFKDERINIIDDQSYPSIFWKTLADGYSIPMLYDINKKLISKIDVELPDKYITISTKVLIPEYDLNSVIPYSKWEAEKYNLFKILNESNYKIIILGERKIKECKEYNIHKTYSIYDDLKYNLNNYIDMTIEDSESNNNLYLLKKTFFVMNKANLNIFMTFSGLKTTSLYISNNVLGLVPPNDEYNFSNKECFLHENCNIYYTFYYEDFIEKLINFLNTGKL